MGTISSGVGCVYAWRASLVDALPATVAKLKRKLPMSFYLTRLKDQSTLLHAGISFPHISSQASLCARPWTSIKRKCQCTRSNTTIDLKQTLYYSRYRESIPVYKKVEVCQCDPSPVMQRCLDSNQNAFIMESPKTCSQGKKRYPSNIVCHWNLPQADQVYMHVLKQDIEGNPNDGALGCKDKLVMKSESWDENLVTCGNPPTTRPAGKIYNSIHSETPSVFFYSDDMEEGYDFQILFVYLSRKVGFNLCCLLILLHPCMYPTLWHSILLAYACMLILTHWFICLQLPSMNIRGNPIPRGSVSNSGRRNTSTAIDVHSQPAYNPFTTCCECPEINITQL